MYSHLFALHGASVRVCIVMKSFFFPPYIIEVPAGQVPGAVLLVSELL